MFICRKNGYIQLCNHHLWRREGIMDEYEELKKYYVNAIMELLKMCQDVELLDLILKLLL